MSERFTDNGDGTITDNTSDLIWLKDANCFGQLDWYEATEAVAKLADGQCGLTDGSVAGDWALPERTELLTLFVCRYNPSMQDKCFSNLQFDFYWSATSYADCSDATWLMRLDPGCVDYGQVYYENKTARPHPVWPVRCGQ